MCVTSTLLILNVILKLIALFLNEDAFSFIATHALQDIFP